MMTTTSIDGAIFDMDGLLVESEPSWWASEIECFAKVGITLSEADCESTCGIRIDQIVEQRYGEAPWDEALVSRSALTERIVDAMEVHIASAPVKRGACAAIEFCRAQGCAIAVASSSPLRLITAFVENHADVKAALGGCPLISAESEPFGKPHPAVYLTACGVLGIEPSRCVAFEDSVNGSIAAKAALMNCVAVPEPELVSPTDGSATRRERLLFCDAVLTSLDEVDDALWARLSR